MTEEILNTIVSYPSKRAANEPSRLMLLGERLHQIVQDDANYFTYMMQEIIEKIAAHIVEESSPPHSLAAMKTQLSMAFMYCFDKSVETTYKIRIGAKRDVRFSFEDLYHGMGGDRIPVYLQLKVTPVIERVALIFQDTFDFVNRQYAEQYATKELIKPILFGGMFLGTEFCFRLDLRNQSEYKRLMEE